MKTSPTNPTQPLAPRRRCRLVRRSPKSRGAVMVLALLGGFMIIGLIGYVFNTGRHAQLRQQTQSAADATAISGAGYVARSFNTVAMNNVEISRLIAVVQMLDAVPLATEYTLLDVRATLETVQDQLGRGVCPVRDSLINRLASDAQVDAGELFDGLAADLQRLIRDNLANGIDQAVEDSLEEIEEDLIDQERQLIDMDEFFNRGSYDVREMTFYDSEFGRGELWSAMESLDAINVATMEQIEELTQLTAINTGRRNMRGTTGETLAAVAPFDRGIAWQRYEFDDFRNPVVRGRLPIWVDDEVTNRGPYDTIFGWRSTQRESIEIPNPDYEPATGGARPESRWSGGTGDGGRPTITVDTILTGYTTYGTWQAIGDILRNRVDEPEVLYNSQFVTRVNRMSGNKLNYLWPGSARTWVFLDPQWITDLDQAQEIIDAGTPRAAYTQFIRQDVSQSFTFMPYDGALLTAIGETTPYRIGDEFEDDWDIIRPRGGWTSVPGISEKTCDHVWDDGGTSITPGQERLPIVSMELGQLRSIVNQLRNVPEYTLYKEGGIELADSDPAEDARWIDFPTVRVEVVIFRFVWAGMNVGPEIIIRDPNNFVSRADLPAPTDFDHDSMQRPVDGAPGFAGSPYAFLGLVKQPNAAPMWRGLFNTSAYDGHAGIAQASVFNNHSWDLWTQMWHAQLEPVQDYEQWIDLIQDQTDLALGYDDLSVGELEELTEYLESLEALAPIMLTH